MNFYNFLYGLTLTCFITEILAVIVYVRFLWIFRFYFGNESPWLWNLICLFVCGVVFFQMALGVESLGWSFEDNAQFLLNDAKIFCKLA